MTHRFLDQPRSVWAVAFACVVAFMGIGLVDPILPVLAHDLDATPSQVSLLFTSYFAMTGLSMLVTGWFASRIGPRRTLLVRACAGRRVLGARRRVRHRLPDRRLPARVGVRQRAVHRHRAVGDRRRRDRRADERDHPLRGRARARDRVRAAARRRARRHLVARPVLRHGGVDGDRLHPDRDAARAGGQARRTASRSSIRCARSRTAGCARWRSWPCSTTSASSRSWPTRRCCWG